ncbi:hypothetical protein CKO28_18720 [Rhodovibrio sodomensis]|uniref:Uncharacterized protein n=1 Tax=Rhodovibrio sodomensis TaxID=1088 RepID=A0ABS1DJH9_9PROT|nr:hypothetical protein [Rhodovibrio sodomensis]MBK1670072.1 hypothetical protein [Rhodovibrio sodomensis]
MDLKDAKLAKDAGNPKLRALVKQVGDLVQEARSQEAMLQALETRLPADNIDNFDQEVDQRWQTIERLAAEILDARPYNLADAAGQAAVAWALSNAGCWDEDHCLTAAVRTLAASAPAMRDDPALVDAMRKLNAA